MGVKIFALLYLGGTFSYSEENETFSYSEENIINFSQKHVEKYFLKWWRLKTMRTQQYLYRKGKHS